MGGLIPPFSSSSKPGILGMYGSTSFNVVVCTTGGAAGRWGDLGTECVGFEYTYGSIGLFTISPVGSRIILRVAIPFFAETFTGFPLLLTVCATPQ